MERKRLFNRIKPVTVVEYLCSLCSSFRKEVVQAELLVVVRAKSPRSGLRPGEAVEVLGAAKRWQSRRGVPSFAKGPTRWTCEHASEMATCKQRTDFEPSRVASDVLVLHTDINQVHFHGADAALALELRERVDS